MYPQTLGIKKEWKWHADLWRDFYYIFKLAIMLQPFKENKHSYKYLKNINTLELFQY